MLSVYVPHGACLERRDVAPTRHVPENGIWFDLVTPTITEDKLLERHLGIAVPTREEMQEIEVTSRLYVENGARYMTATLMCQSDTTRRRRRRSPSSCRATGWSPSATTTRSRSRSSATSSAAPRPPAPPAKPC